MAKRRFQDSSRASWLARKSEKSIGRILVQIPPGERKSGMPHSVEMPAPVNGTTLVASSTRSRKCRMAVSRSDAIIAILSLTRPALRPVGSSEGKRGHDAIPAHHAARAQARCSPEFLLQPLRARGGPKEDRREEQVHTGVSC